MEHKKDIVDSVNPPESKTIIIFQLFQKDNYLLFIYKKIERVVSALYLVSNLLSDNEPLKWQFRNLGTSMISNVLSLTSSPLLVSTVTHELISELVRLLSLLDISSVAGLISEMNFSILKKEIEHLLETLKSRGFSKPLGDGKRDVLDRQFFAVPQEHFLSDVSAKEDFRSAEPPRDRLSATSLYSHVDLERFQTTHLKGHTPENRKETSPKTAASEGRRDSEFHKGQGVSKSSISSREELIISLLKKNNTLTIKGFSSVIKGCSEKTIQRELLRLVKISVLKKEGERRWSRYSLIAP